MDKIDFSGKPRAHELKLIHNLWKILKLFKKATNLSQGQNVITSSEVIVCILSLREQLIKLSKDYSCRLFNSLESSVDTRLSKHEYTKMFLLATVLDPRYKLDWCTYEVDTIRSGLLKKAREITPCEMLEEEELSPPEKGARLEFMKDRSQVSRSQQAVGPSSEVEEYLSLPSIPDDNNVFGFWKNNKAKYPTIVKLASIYVAIPPSLAPVERISSIAGKIFRPERCCLTDDHFQNSMFVRYNTQ